ncbi:MAG TPA: phosphoglycerate dehydrogenase [Methylomirabilota bacterium]|nr:phosphoglycerate dehydrogenase [Methylomirabilota bacterium]
MAWKVFISARTFTHVGKEAVALLRNAGCEVTLPEAFGGYKADEVLRRFEGYDAVLASPDAFTADVLRSPALQNLKIISRWGVGYDSIHIPTATEQGVVVAFTPGMLNETVADYTFGLLLAISRKIHSAHLAMHQGGWGSQWGHDVHGKTLGIIGCGRIGQAVAKRAAGFDMRVIGYDPTPGIQCPTINFVSLEELLRQSHFISLHAALTEENRGLIGEKELRQVRPDAYIINTARGPLIQESALLAALKEGWIAGAALDVFDSEPLPKESPLRTAPNLLMSPHNCPFARETAEKVSTAAAEAIVELLHGRKPRWVVNPEVFNSPKLRALIK